MTDNNEDCPNPDDPEYVQQWNRYNLLRQQNQRKEMKLRQEYGPNARLADTDALEQRLAMVTNALLPIDSLARIEMEVKWQEVLAASLENMHAQIAEVVRQQKAEAAKPKLHIPGGRL